MLAPLAVVQVAGCGGGSDVSKAEYVENANAACSESNERPTRSGLSLGEPGHCTHTWSKSTPNTGWRW
jgi:hypothetical protein